MADSKDKALRELDRLARDINLNLAEAEIAEAEAARLEAEVAGLKAEAARISEESGLDAETRAKLKFHLLNKSEQQELLKRLAAKCGLELVGQEPTPETPAEEFASFRRLYEDDQNPRQLIGALKAAHFKQSPLPDWLVEAIVPILEERYREGPGGSGKRSPAKKDQQLLNDLTRHQCVKRLLEKGTPRVDVFAKAEKELLGSDASTGARGIEESYTYIERIKRWAGTL